jgi:hypothetical protein
MRQILTSFPLLALVATFAALLWLYSVGVHRKVLNRAVRTALVACLLILFSGQAVLVYRAAKTPPPRPKPEPGKNIDLTVVLSVPESRTEIAQVPFRVGSGSVNLGCEETRHVHVEFILPPGGEHPEATAQWVNVDNLSASNASAITVGDRVDATGVIQGRPKTLFFNCPGGGHGELVLSGQYELRKILPTDPTILKSVRDQAYRGQIFTVALPVPITQPIDVTVSAADSGGGLKGKIVPHDSGDISLEIVSKVGPIPQSIRIVGQTLIIVV